jgi:SAM-dependent methyltransferase
MDGLLDAALANPWATLDAVIDGPLHPGGTEATARLLDRTDIGPGTRLLDVGCGTGDALMLARERGADAVGIDPSPTTDWAVRGDATALPIRDRCMDVVLAECVLCLTDLPAALGEVHRVLEGDGRLALSDVVVDGERPALSDQVAEALCLEETRNQEQLRMRLEDVGFDVRATYDHHDDLVAMRDRVTDRIDYEGLLGAMGERGRRVLDTIEALETAVETGRVSYVSIVASVDSNTGGHP